MSKSKRKIKEIFLITGNKVIDGLIVFFLGLIFLGIGVLTVKVYGYPGIWWQYWGGFWSQMAIGLWIALMGMGFVYAFIGFRYFIVGLFETLLIPEKLLYVAVVYIPAIVSLTLLTMYAILPAELYAELFKWLIDKVLVFIVGALIGYLYAKTQ